MSHKEYCHIGDPIVRLIEECSEVIQIACKIQRFGLTSYHPEDVSKTPNIELLRKEMQDVIQAYSCFEDTQS